MTETDETHINRLVLGEQAYAVFKSRMEAMPASFVLAVSVTIIMRGEVRHDFLYTWLVGISTLITAQFCMSCFYFRKYRFKFNPKLMLNICCTTTLISSLIWCVIPLIFIDTNNRSWEYIVLILCGLTSAAALHGAAYPRVAILFFTPILLSLIFKIYSEQTRYSLIFACEIGLYLICITRASLLSQKIFKSNSILKHQANVMAHSLLQEHEAASAANARLYQLANNDILTGLFNRGACLEQMSVRCTAALNGKRPLCLLLLDLDGFKPINDSLGHKAGDEVLQHVAARLSKITAENRFLARLGGDEFAVLVDLDGLAASQVAQRIIDVIGQPITIGSSAVSVGVSIGIANIPEDCSSPEDLRIRADLALYAAKGTGRNRFRRFDVDMLAHVELSRDLEHDLPFALADGSIEVWYQPQVRLGDQSLLGIEALIRWSHPKHGFISPPLIIETAQRTVGSATMLDFVLDNACATLRALAEAGHSGIVVAVNVSPSEIEHCPLINMVKEKVKFHKVDRRRLELEITENSLITSQSVIDTLNTLSDTGFRLAIDDFGAGCSSISYLRALRVHRIKIDRGFITGFTQREADRRLVQMILGIGQSLDIEVVAEGVETSEEAALLQTLGCSVAQGYLFGRAMPRKALDKWAVERRTGAGVGRRLFASQGAIEAAEESRKTGVSEAVLAS